MNERYKPHDFWKWSVKDREDYTYIVDSSPGGHPIPEATLAKMSTRVLKAAEQLYVQIQCEIEYGAVMSEQR